MADEEAEQEVLRVLDALDVLQSMIDISADRLEGLRTQCATSAELTQQEIRTLEGKLIKLFSKQLVTKAKLEGDPSGYKRVPSLEQWLQVVGLSPESIKCICQRMSTVESLQEKSEHELHVILSDRHAREEEVRRLTRALHNLKKYTDILLQGGGQGGEGSEPVLYWDSWDHRRGAKAAGAPSASPRPPRASATAVAAPSVAAAVTPASRTTRPSLPCAGGGGDDDDPDDGCTCSCVSHTNSVSSQAASLAGSPTRLTAPMPLSPPPSLPQPASNHHPHHLHHHLHHYQQVPPPSPPPAPPPLSNSHHYTPPSTPPVGKGGPADRVKFPTTPPPCRRHQTCLAGALLPESYPLTKSKSHESQLANRVEGSDGSSGSGEHGSGPPTRIMRGRLPTEPGPNCTSDLGQMSPQLSSPIKSPPYCAPLDGDDYIHRTTLQVPKSPRTPTTFNRGMGHTIAHRFTKAFKVMATCDYCDKQMLFGTSLKCKECKYKCHRECESKVPPSCGLPRDFLDYFSKTVQTDGSVFLPNQSPKIGLGSHSSSAGTIWPKIRGPSQQPINIPPFATGPDSSSNTSSCNSSTPSSPALMAATHTPQPVIKQQFHFPDVEHMVRCGVTLETHPLPPAPSVDDAADTHRSNDSDRTVSGSGSASTDSERTPVRVDSQDSQVSDGEAVERHWPRQNSLSMREWDIPYDELKIGEPIGTGRFGIVFRGNWHGDVAIKVLNMDHLDDDDKVLEGFKLEVATFRKTRHENLVLFMGACMKPPRLAIVTSMCKGMTLYTHIHLRKDKFNMNKTTIVAQQISQGMGYLHARGIVHKDLKSKNIFLENGKVIITDFGLFSVTKLCFGNRRGNGLSIPPGWLCYLSPEILRSLRVSQEKHDEEELPFTQASDVYAFGTVWYELLCGEWPFKAQPPEAIIWQVGKGMKQSLANLQASRDVKDILMLCWSYRPGDRPDFTQLLKTLEKLPKKRLARSPSHPIHLSRSAESVF